MKRYFFSRQLLAVEVEVDKLGSSEATGAKHAAIGLRADFARVNRSGLSRGEDALETSGASVLSSNPAPSVMEAKESCNARVKCGLSRRDALETSGKEAELVMAAKESCKKRMARNNTERLKLLLRGGYDEEREEAGTMREI